MARVNGYMAAIERLQTCKFLSVICAYASTARAPPGVGSQFLSDLQNTLDKISPNVVLVILGDFNASLGVLKLGHNMWHGMLEKHGPDKRNKAGEEFLQFCSINQLPVMSMWFQKKSIYFGTWIHPATKNTL